MSTENWNGEHPANELIGAFHDGEIDSALSKRVEDHINSCAACRKELDGLVALDAVGPLFREDVPAEPFWENLERRIQAGVAESARKDVPVAAGSREVPLERDWWSRIFGRPALRLGLATAAGLAVILVTTRIVMDRMGERPLARQTRAEGLLDQKTASAPAPVRTDSLSGPRAFADEPMNAVPGPSGTLPVVPRTEDLKKDSPVDQEAANENQAKATEKQDAGAGRFKMAEDVRKETPVSEASGAGGANERDDKAEAGEAAGEPAATTKAGPASMAAAPRLQGGVNEAMAYVAEVEIALDSTASEVVAPEGMEEKIRTEAQRRRIKPRYEDYQIAFAAASRALEGHKAALSVKGFTMVAQGAPETELARDAEFNIKVAQFRIREEQGEDRGVLMTEFQNTWDQAWDRAQDLRTTPACRNALASERARILLMKEITPGVDLGPYEERIKLLKACS